MEWLTRANQEFARTYPGETGLRQPVHTVYGGAHLFKHDTSPRLGALAEAALANYAPDAATLALALGISPDVADPVYSRVLEKLHREPVEDFRLDFEDGYGNRTDAEEDAAAEASAKEVARGMAEGVLPAFIGIRIKPLNEALKARGLRTLEHFLNTLLDHTGGRLPGNFAVTLPKITVPEQVRALVETLDRFGVTRIEMMIETPQSLFLIPRLIEAARGRCVGLHFGPYDYTASLGITFVNQHVLHPACEFARSMMQAQAAGTGVPLSDGPTTLIPVPIYKGPSLSGEQIAKNRAAVQGAWKQHYQNIRHALDSGLYQGWDLHPAQLPARYAAVYSFFLEGLCTASDRLRNFVDKAARASMAAGVFDDAATGQGLLNFFLRAINCGAVREGDIPPLTGLTLDELRSASFVKIIEGRRAAR